MEIHSEKQRQQTKPSLSTQEKFNLLHYLCQNLDPYQEISSEMKEMLKKVGITELSDPYEITNQLILMMEDALNKKQDTTKLMQ